MWVIGFFVCFFIVIYALSLLFLCASQGDVKFNVFGYFMLWSFFSIDHFGFFPMIDTVFCFLV